MYLVIYDNIHQKIVKKNKEIANKNLKSKLGKLIGTF